MSTGRSRRMMDILFTLALFCVFAVCSLMVVVMGADVYRKGTREMQDNYDTRTSLSYLSTKLRQTDSLGSITLRELEGTPALVLGEEIDGTRYLTWIYCREGSLQEVFTLEGLTPTPQMGRVIMALEGLEAEFLSTGTLKVTAVEAGGRSDFLLHTPRSS